MAVTALTNNKAEELNTVPPNAFKTLNNDNLTHLLDLFNEHWLEKTNFYEWHECQILPVPKSGDLSDPKKCCGVTLMDIREKRFSSILCERAFKIIKSHGVKYHFGSTPGVGFQDKSFTLKILLHLINNHKFPS